MSTTAHFGQYSRYAVFASMFCQLLINTVCSVSVDEKRDNGEYKNQRVYSAIITSLTGRRRLNGAVGP